ncbi:FkbM family methyltransferase [Cesiribacter sp. SM1]|uniref:FkbM family methyltransferase n=1 Tax=Cesiribacter sp. SM1 TaxID=2861196 RepID=UPI001CD46779|nr:FkbM family methyltransferase [Cesiribacter sp. SM1]
MNTFFIRALNKLNYLENFNLSGSVCLNGKVFKVPLHGKIGLGNLLMNEPWMIDVLKIALKVEDRTFIDIGVNVGQTLLKLRSVSDSIRYVGFEPNPGCISYVNKLIKDNRLTNIELVPVGVSTVNQIGKLVFFNENPADSYASIIDDPRPNKKVNRKEFIPLFNMGTIRNYVEFENISVLKIDVEGAELEVLTSFREELKKYDPIILMEILPVYKPENKSRLQRQNSIEALLKEAGYILHRVVKKHKKLADIIEIDEIGIHSNLKNCDYVIVPHTKLAQFKEHFQEWRAM